MIRRKFIGSVSLILVIVMTSCLKSLLCVRGDGIMQTETRRVTNFNELENSTSFDVIYKKADTFGILVRAEQNIINYIETNVYDDCLEITTSPATVCLKYTERPLITVACPSLIKVYNTGSGEFIGDELSDESLILKVSGSGDINIENISCDYVEPTITGSGNIDLKTVVCINFDCLITGSGDISANGYCEDANLKITGSGSIYGADMVCNNTSVIISGSGNVYSTTTDYLNALLSGSGNIFIRGNPDIDQTITGTGRIISYK
jgi:hypothetical protein